MGACLQANSASGQAAARLDEDAYGLVHRATLDVDGIRDRIRDMIKAADPKGVGIEVSIGTVVADAAGICLFTCLIASIYPAFVATRTSSAESLHYE